MGEVWFYQKEKREEVRQLFLKFLQENGYSESDFKTIKIELFGDYVSNFVLLIDKDGERYWGERYRGGRWEIFAIESRRPHTTYDAWRKLGESFREKTGIRLAVM